MGPVEQRMQDEYAEAHERLYRQQWRKPKLEPLPSPIELDLHRLIKQAEQIEFIVTEGRDDMPAARRPKIKEVQQIVARFYRQPLADMLSHRRSAFMVYPRQVAMFLAYKFTRRSLPEIGRAFGGRDHTTVLHALRKIERLRQSDARLADELQLLTMRICEATGWHEEAET